MSFKKKESLILNKKGQSMVEAALVLAFLIIIILLFIGVGLYIYDMSVYVFAANKTMDMGISKLSQDDITLVDEISGNELDSSARAEMISTALDTLSLTVGTKPITEDNVHIATVEGYDGVMLTVRLTGEYDFSIPVFGDALPDFDYDLDYYYYY